MGRWGSGMRGSARLEELLGLRLSRPFGGGRRVGGEDSHDVLKGFGDLSSKPVRVLRGRAERWRPVNKTTVEEEEVVMQM